MKNYWLFKETKNKHCKLGDAEDSIPIPDRQAILDVIPHGWRIMRYDDTQWTFSRLVSSSIPFKVLHIVEMLMDVTLCSNPRKVQSKVPQGWSSVQNALYTVGPEDNKPLLSTIHNVLQYANGSCGIYEDTVEDTTVGDFMDFSEHRIFNARDALMSLELGMTIPTISNLELHNVIALRDSVLNQGFPIQPSFDGEMLSCNLGGIMASHLALCAIKTCADAACMCMYNTIEMQEWWYSRAHRILGVEGVRMLNEAKRANASNNLDLPEIMMEVCVTVCASLYPTVMTVGLFMQDILSVCICSLMFGVQKHLVGLSTEKYAAYLCKDDESIEHVLKYILTIIEVTEIFNKVPDGIAIPDPERISSLLMNKSSVQIIEAFKEFAPFSIMACSAIRHSSEFLGASKSRIDLLIDNNIPDGILQLVFGDDMLVKEYKKFAFDKVVELDRTLLAPDSVWEGEGSLANIMEGL